MQEFGPAGDRELSGDARIGRSGQVDHVQRIHALEGDRVSAVADRSDAVQILVRLADFFGPRIVGQAPNDLSAWSAGFSRNTNSR